MMLRFPSLTQAHFKTRYKMLISECTNMSAIQSKRSISCMQIKCKYAFLLWTADVKLGESRYPYLYCFGHYTSWNIITTLIMLKDKHIHLLLCLLHPILSMHTFSKCMPKGGWPLMPIMKQHVKERGTPLCRLCGRLDDFISEPTRAVGATVTAGTVTLIGLPRRAR